MKRKRRGGEQHVPSSDNWIRHDPTGKDRARWRQGWQVQRRASPARGNAAAFYWKRQRSCFEKRLAGAAENGFSAAKAAGDRTKHRLTQPAHRRAEQLLSPLPPYQCLPQALRRRNAEKTDRLLQTKTARRGSNVTRALETRQKEFRKWIIKRFRDVYGQIFFGRNVITREGCWEYFQTSGARIGSSVTLAFVYINKYI